MAEKEWVEIKEFLRVFRSVLQRFHPEAYNAERFERSAAKARREHAKGVAFMKKHQGRPLNLRELDGA
jgi:rRNA maturation protein Rpf1